ncbi:hypothetical protein L950_0227330 [Sphingobacterium sp. IITKGP-BTPF85]|nr:hypothetical protein L950_0227330 [Sphingobacterium sp. IITKGP-BTPF85]
MQLVEMEALLMQHSRDSSAAGAIRSVVSRVCDILPTVSAIAEILHPEVNFGERVSKLLLRLELGIPSSIVELAEILGRTLNRGEYLELLKIGIINKDRFINADKQVLLSILSYDKIDETNFKIEKYIQEQLNVSAIVEIPLYED